MAVATTDDARLRDSYLALALQYERLAMILEKSERAAEEPVETPKSQPRAGSGNG